MIELRREQIPNFVFTDNKKYITWEYDIKYIHKYYTSLQ